MLFITESFLGLPFLILSAMTKIEKMQITDHLDTDHFGVICMLLLNLDGMYFMIGSSLSGGFLKERS